MQLALHIIVLLYFIQVILMNFNFTIYNTRNYKTYSLPGIIKILLGGVGKPSYQT